MSLHQTPLRMAWHPLIRAGACAFLAECFKNPDQAKCKTPPAGAAYGLICGVWNVALFPVSRRLRPKDRSASAVSFWLANGIPWALSYGTLRLLFPEEWLPSRQLAIELPLAVLLFNLCCGCGLYHQHLIEV